MDNLLKSGNNFKEIDKKVSSEDKKFVSFGGKAEQIGDSYKNTEINIEEKKLKMKNEWDNFLEKSEDQFDAEIEAEN